MKPIDGEKLIENLRRYKHEVISVDGLEGLISLMPSVVTEPVAMPIINVAEGYDSIVDEDGNMGFGVYDPTEKRIWVAGDLPHEMFVKALFHELMHWIQDVTGRQFDEDEANHFSDMVYDVLLSVQPEQCEDAVSRKDAIRWVKTECNPYGKPALDFESGKKVIEHLECMSAVTPERAKGKWISEAKGKEAILDEFGNVTCSAHCSECGDWLTASDEYSCRGRYCPNCGADMRGEKDEQR